MCPWLEYVALLYAYIIIVSTLQFFVTIEIVLDFQPTAYTVHESDGIVTNIIDIAKVDDAPPSEVNIPLRVLILRGSADVGPGKGQRLTTFPCHVYGMHVTMKFI